MSEDLQSTRTPWWTLGIDLECVVAALGALLVGILLGWLWSPLFWIGFAAMLVALAAGRKSNRTPPSFASAIVAPCDGRVVSIERVEAPADLQLEADVVLRVRITSAPTATNKLYAPIAGDVDSVALEAGEPTRILATKPNMDGLSLANIVVSRELQQIGMRFAQGGSDLWLDLDIETGDTVRMGRAFGTRRLGGWCDVFLPEDAGALIWVGQSLIGGETVMARLQTRPDEELFDLEEDFIKTAPVVDINDAPGDSEASTEDDPGEQTDSDVPEDPAEMFARLKEAATRKEDD